MKVLEGSRIDFPVPLELSGVARDLVGLGFEIHSPGFAFQQAMPLVIDVTLRPEAGMEDVHFKLVYERIADVAPRIVEDILKKIK